MVTSYGADPSGARDSTLAIRQAIGAAEAKGGWQTVYFPPGTYLLDDHDGAAADFDLQGATVNILGAGHTYVKLVEKVGTDAYPALKRGKNVFVFSKMNDFYIDGLTIDSQTYNVGDTIDDYGNSSTIQDIAALGARHGSGAAVDSANVFDLRVLAVCNANPSNALYDVYHSGNVVNDVILSGRGGGGNDDLDISCQHDDTISNIVDTGWGMALYIDQGVTVHNYSFTPAGTNPDFRGWFITASSDITIDGFTTTGEGGRISSPAHPSSAITIEDEHMETPGYSMVIGDSNGVVIRNSSLQQLVVAPTEKVQGLTVLNTSVASVSCKAHALISDLSGVSC